MDDDIFEPEPLGPPEEPPAGAMEPFDPVLALTAMTLAAIAACAASLLTGRETRFGDRRLAQVGCLVGVGAGFVAACWWLEIWPSWPPSHDRGWFLWVLWPAVLIVEAIAVVAGRPRWLGWLLRAALAAAAGPLLVYFASWPIWQTMPILAALAIGLWGEWLLLAKLVERSPSPSIPIALTVAVLAVGVPMMSSSYFTGGLLSLPLAGSLIGTALALAVAPGRMARGWLGPGLIGLFSLVVMSHFSGTLSTMLAVLLFAAPLLQWVGEVPSVRGMKAWQRESLRMLLAMAPIAMAV